MSQFLSAHASHEAQAMRRYLNMSKSAYLEFAWQYRDKGSKRHPEALMLGLQSLVNAKSEAAESASLTLGERIQHAKSYLYLSYSGIGRRMEVSREAVRLWCANKTLPTDLTSLSAVLKVDLRLLETGDTTFLAPNARIGLRVGAEHERAKAMLLQLTEQFFLENAASCTDEELEDWLFRSPEIAMWSRRAGGRWIPLSGTLKFKPWVAPERVQPRVSKWPDETEAIIAEVMALGRSEYWATAEIQRRCTAKCLAHPTRIGLYKRWSKERQREGRFGINV